MFVPDLSGEAAENPRFTVEGEPRRSGRHTNVPCNPDLWGGENAEWNCEWTQRDTNRTRGILAGLLSDGAGGPV